jgi:hypothetical protein
VPEDEPVASPEEDVEVPEPPYVDRREEVWEKELRAARNSWVPFPHMMNYSKK